MGCDIHAHLEYYSKEDASQSKCWVTCFAKNLTFNRNYTLFNAMANVRGIGGGINPKGLPTTPFVSYEVADLYYLSPVQSPNVTSPEYRQQHNIKQENYRGENRFRNPFWHSTSHLMLSEMIAVRRMYLTDTLEFDCTYTGKKRQDIRSKINTANDYELMKLCFTELECPPLNATIASMIAIENSGEYYTRLVFWFDS